MRLLIVGDLSGNLGKAGIIAANNGAKIKHANNIIEAMELLREGSGADIAFVEIRYDIRAFIQQLESERFSLPIIACGFESDAKLAGDAIRAGAREYMPLPPDEKLIVAILEAVVEETNNVIAASPQMQAVISLADRIAKSEATVLITGQSGTGKEVIAQYIHKNSNRSDKAFISLNCAAIPENLLESELFGHEKGAFTGAVARRIGKFEEADKGTILLDEISEMDLRLQAKLLRVLQEREFDRVGGNKPVKVDIRVLATSNRDLEFEVREGRFREDLYFRLNVISIELPPLSSRKEDILLLAEFFLNKYSSMNGIKLKPISKEAAEVLINYPWVGNVRELENTMYRAALLAMGEEIQPLDLRLKEVSSEEKDLTKAANILGISIKTLKDRMDLYEKKTA